MGVEEVGGETGSPKVCEVTMGDPKGDVKVNARLSGGKMASGEIKRKGRSRGPGR